MTKIINLFGGAGAGKCFGINTKIVMGDGTLKNIQDITTDDYVLGIDSKAKKVLNVHSGVDQLYLVKQNRALNYIVNSKHELCLQRSKIRNSKRRYPNLENEITISVEDYLNTSKKFKENFKGYKVKSEFDYQDVYIDPYWLGLWLGDGKSDNTGITSMDSEIINFIEEHADSLSMTTSYYDKPNNKALDVSTINKSKGNINKLLQKIKHYNIRNNKHIPHEFIFNSEEVRNNILAGIIDSDGFMDNNCYYITLKSEQLSYSVYRLSNSLGLKTKIKPIMKTCTNNGKRGLYYHISISGDLDKIPVKLQRKITTCKLRNNPYQTGINIEKINIGQYFGIEVEDHLMLLEDNTVVHNSSTSSNIFYLLKKNGYNAEHTNEYAKQLTYEKNWRKIKNQGYLFEKQHQQIFRLVDLVDYVIMDSPLLLSAIYDVRESEHFKNYVLEVHNVYDNINIFIRRETIYQQSGRYHTEAEAIEIDNKILKFLKDNNIPYVEVGLDAGEEIITKALGLNIPTEIDRLYNNPKILKQILEKVRSCYLDYGFDMADINMNGDVEDWTDLVLENICDNKTI